MAKHEISSGEVDRSIDAGLAQQAGRVVAGAVAPEQAPKQSVYEREAHAKIEIDRNVARIKEHVAPTALIEVLPVVTRDPSPTSNGLWDFMEVAKVECHIFIGAGTRDDADQSQENFFWALADPEAVGFRGRNRVYPSEKVELLRAENVWVKHGTRADFSDEWGTRDEDTTYFSLVVGEYNPGSPKGRRIGSPDRVKEYIASQYELLASTLSQVADRLDLAAQAPVSA